MAKAEDVCADCSKKIFGRQQYLECCGDCDQRDTPPSSKEVGAKEPALLAVAYNADTENKLLGLVELLLARVDKLSAVVSSQGQVIAALRDQNGELRAKASETLDAVNQLRAVLENPPTVTPPEKQLATFAGALQKSAEPGKLASTAQRTVAQGSGTMTALNPSASTTSHNKKGRQIDINDATTDEANDGFQEVRRKKSTMRAGKCKSSSISSARRPRKSLFNWSWNLSLFRSSHQLSNKGPFKEILASPLSDRWPPCKDQTPSWISRPAKTSGHSLLGSASSPCDHRFSLTQSAQPPSSEPSDGIEPRLRLHPITIGINGPWLLLAFELESATSSQVEPSDSLAQLSMVHQKLDLLLSLKETVESLKELHPKVDSLLSLRQTVDTMRDTIATMQESLTFFSSEYDILVKATASQDKAIKELQSETITLRSTVLEQAREIQKLKADQNDTDQASRLCNMEIHGIPFSPRENLVDLMTGLAGKLNIESFQLADVVAAHRLPAKPGTVPPLLIRTLDVVSWTAGLP
ncbi:hypothetical protein HPB47_027277 [Ixodes persulcatus]|uniref:Uncharacterized protein n=1 Tax=Ixodes persulcatus TaxID=34615 RepID=A0AC60PXJ3_IXOPE|nr:hypothetical protein HPB47_027277 [Ixodes persulcatus]